MVFIPALLSVMSTGGARSNLTAVAGSVGSVIANAFT
jgi:hypothetical protein